MSEGTSRSKGKRKARDASQEDVPIKRLAKKLGKDKASKEDKEEGKEQTKTKGRMKNDNEANKLTSRCCPHALMEAISKMNDEQLQMVRSMGFAGILSLNVSRLPNQICYWLVENYDPKRSELVISDGRRVDVNENDVLRAFGFPKGELVIGTKKNHNQSNVVDEWVWQFTRSGMVENKNKITANHVTEAMIADKNGGKMFRMNFLVLLASALIQSTTHGYIYPFFSDPLEENSDAKDWNWCELLIRCLIDSAHTWKECKTKPFFGPSLFLLIFYVDRVCIFNQCIGRQLPLIVNWDRVELRKRQWTELNNGGFGEGRVLDAVDIKVLEHGHLGKIAEQPTTSHQVAGTSTAAESTLKYSGLVMKQAEFVAGEMVKLMKMIEEAPAELFKNNSFKKTIGAASRIIGCGVPETIPLADESVEDDDEEFWNSDTVKEAMFAIDTARLKVSNYMDDLPSFSLGMTQLFATTQNEEQRDKVNVMDNDEEQTSKPIDAEIGQVVGEANEAIASVIASINKDCCTGEQKDTAMGERRDETEGQDDTTNNPPEHAGNVLEQVEVESETEGVGKGSTEVEVSTRMPCRKKTALRSANAKKSPYIMRYVDASRNLTKREIQLCWFSTFVADDDFLLFDWNGIKVNAKNMQSLRQNHSVDNVIVDAWSAILNNREHVKSDESLLRLFATLSTGTVVCPARRIDPFKKQKNFNLGMAKTLTAHRVTDLNRIQMFVFPIENDGCYYIICFDLRMKKTWIIDNTTDDKNVDWKVKYGRIPTDLTLLLQRYLIKVKCTSRGKIVKSCKVTMMVPDWGDNSNILDSGVYTMRHMETFKGGESSWDTGFIRKGLKQVKLLRVRYCFSIVSMDENINKYTVEQEAVGNFEENELNTKEVSKILLDN